MNGCNLTGLNPGSKALRALLLLTVIAVLASCSADMPTTAREGSIYDGSYVAVRVVEIPDDVTEYVYGGSDLMGLMVIRDSVYSLDVFFSIGMNIFGRSDSGRLHISGDFVFFNTVTDTTLMNVPWGEFVEEKQELKISYLKNNHLWTETWKRATPVVDSDTSFNYIPF